MLKGILTPLAPSPSLSHPTAVWLATLKRTRSLTTATPRVNRRTANAMAESLKKDANARYWEMASKEKRSHNTETRVAEGKESEHTKD